MKNMSSPNVWTHEFKIQSYLVLQVTWIVSIFQNKQGIATIQITSLPTQAEEHNSSATYDGSKGTKLLLLLPGSCRRQWRSFPHRQHGQRPPCVGGEENVSLLHHPLQDAGGVGGRANKSGNLPLTLAVRRHPLQLQGCQEDSFHNPPVWAEGLRNELSEFTQFLMGKLALLGKYFGFLACYWNGLFVCIFFLHLCLFTILHCTFPFFTRQFTSITTMTHKI